MLGFGRHTIVLDGDRSRRVTVSCHAVDVVLRSTVIDMLGLLTLDWPRLMTWQRSPGRFEEDDFRRLEDSAIGIFHPAVETSGADPYSSARRWLKGWRHLSSSACYFDPIDEPSKLSRRNRHGQIGILIGFQNSKHFRDLSDVALFHSLGQRTSQLTYNAHNRLGSGCYERHDRGLTRFGAEVIGEMNRLGMLVDVSHCGERTTLEAIATSRHPTVVSHSNCRALNPWQRRCKSDRVLRGLAERGGVIGMTMVRAFVAMQRQPTLEDLLDHFDHAARVAGIEHVGIGSDVDVQAFDPRTGEVDPIYRIVGLEPRSRAFQIADGLLRRGWTDTDVEGVLGRNFERVLRQVLSSGEEQAGPTSRRDPFCPAPRRAAPTWIAERPGC